MTTSLLLTLSAGGFVAGIIDSIAGGGGLITVPLLLLAVGPGAAAIGTNKIVGTAAALMAFLVYLRGRELRLGNSAIFIASICLGSFLGSRTAPHVPPEAFRIFLAITCPLILWMVWRKDMWIRAAAHEAQAHSPTKTLIAVSGLACGFYDGVWGPGGGTFMLLSLIVVSRLPLFEALLVSKLANTFSAGTALVTYASGGWVRWSVGLPMAASVTAGAFVGASLANRLRASAIRPALAIVSLILAAKLFLD